MQELTPPAASRQGTRRGDPLGRWFQDPQNLRSGVAAFAQQDADLREFPRQGVGDEDHEGALQAGDSFSLAVEGFDAQQKRVSLMSHDGTEERGRGFPLSPGLKKAYFLSFIIL